MGPVGEVVGDRERVYPNCPVTNGQFAEFRGLRGPFTSSGDVGYFEARRRRGRGVFADGVYVVTGGRHCNVSE